MATHEPSPDRGAPTQNVALTAAKAAAGAIAVLRQRRVPGALAILSFFILVFGVFALFFWLAVPPALHELKRSSGR